MLEDFLYGISETGIAYLVRDSLWGYPIFESLHLLGIVIMFSSIALVDLRYLGFGRALSAFEIGEKHLLRFTWGGFGLLVASGLSLFSAYPADNVANAAFQLKFVLIGLAGINMLFFNFRIAKNLAVAPAGSDALGLAHEAGEAPLAGKVSVAISLCLWMGTIACGRLIAYPEIFGG